MGMGAKRRAKECAELPKDSAKKVRVADCRKLMRETLAAEYKEILGAFVQVAKKGSASHMKLATELLEAKEPVGNRRSGSASRLLRELKLRERERAGR